MAAYHRALQQYVSVADVRRQVATFLVGVGVGAPSQPLDADGGNAPSVSDVSFLGPRVTRPSLTSLTHPPLCSLLRSC